MPAYKISQTMSITILVTISPKVIRTYNLSNTPKK